MTTETILTDEQIAQALNLAGATDYADLPLSYDLEIARAVEQAVLQSEQVQALRKDAERYRWTTALDDNAETLYSIVLSYGGDQAKINERVDAYRPDAATKEQP